MLDIGFVKPNYPNEKRVAILPSDIDANKSSIVFDEIKIEDGFGSWMGIRNEEYEAVGCRIVSREMCFASSVVFCLKLIQPSDYHLVRHGARIIGWIHPNGSGASFYKGFAKEKKLILVDLDSVNPRIYRWDGGCIDISVLPRHFFWENSYIAGIASTELAFRYLKIDAAALEEVCVLGAGSVAQGAFCYLSARGLFPRMFYRGRLDLFYREIERFDLVVNGIEMDAEGVHILSEEQIRRMKPDVILVDAAADAGRAIEGTLYRTIDEPAGEVFGRKYILVNNAPTLMFEKASRVISRVVGKMILTRDLFEDYGC